MPWATHQKFTFTFTFTLTLTLLTLCVLTTISASDTSTMLTHTDVEDLKLNFQFNSATIIRILQELNYLSLYLSDASETRSNLVSFLLEQKFCAIQLFIGSFRNGTRRVSELDALDLKFYIPQQHRAIFIQSHELHTTLQYFAKKSGSLMVLISDTVDKSEIIKVATQIWLQSGIYRVYYFLRTRIWFYNPFARRGDLFGDLIDVDQLRRFNSMQIFENLNRYIIRTYIFDSVYSSVYGDATEKRITKVRGADSEAAILLSQKMNFTMELQWPDDEFFGARLENGSFDGAIGRLIRSETDVAMTGFFVKDYLTRAVTFTVSVYMDELCCYVMKAKKIPQSIVPLFAVRPDIWFGFFFVGLFSPLIWMLIRYINLCHTRTDKNHEDSVGSMSKMRISTKSICVQCVRIFIDTWVIWVRVNISRFPPFYSERVFVVSLCLVSVIYGALFESSLATVYIRPLYYKDLNTLQELNDAGFRIYIKHAAMKDDLFYGHSSPVYQNLNRKLLLVAETEERLISMMSKRGGFGAVTRGSSLSLDDIRYIITKRVHKIPECPKNYHIAYVLPRYSPYEEPFNIKLLRFLEAGLIDQWIQLMMHKSKSKIHTFPDYKAEKSNQWKVLTLKDLQLAFYALGLGCLSAFLSLIGELGLRYQKKKFCCAS